MLCLSQLVHGMRLLTFRRWWGPGAIAGCWNRSAHGGPKVLGEFDEWRGMRTVREMRGVGNGTNERCAGRLLRSKDKGRLHNTSPRTGPACIRGQGAEESRRRAERGEEGGGAGREEETPPSAVSESGGA